MNALLALHEPTTLGFAPSVPELAPILEMHLNSNISVKLVRPFCYFAALIGISCQLVTARSAAHTSQIDCKACASQTSNDNHQLVRTSSSSSHSNR